MFSSFVCIFLGLLIGRITIKGVNLGSSGVFIIALLYGALFSSHIKSTISQKTKDNKIIDISSNGLKILENIGLILFIGSVGFISGPNFFTNLKKNFKSYLLVGLLVILSSTLVCVLIFYTAKNSEKNIEEFSVMMVGIFAGALTSTPAFSAAKASAEGEYESAVTVGYGLAYIFGVLGVVLFVQIVPKIMNVDMDIERQLIMDKEYKITKRVGTDRTDQTDQTDQTYQTERTKISRSINGDIQKTDRINIIKHDKKESIDNIVKENKQDNNNNNKKSKFFLDVNDKKEKQSHSRNEEKENIEFEINSNSINTKVNIKSSKNSELDREKEKEIYIIEGKNDKVDINIEEKGDEYNNGEVKEDEEENNQEEKENEDNNQEEKENEDNNQEEKEISESIKNPEKLFILDKYGFCVFGFGALVGIFIGAIRIPLSKEGFNGSAFSLTTTGGVLLTCLCVLGHIGKIKKLSLKVDKKVLENLRELGLILFLMGSGIAGGTKFIEYFKVIYFFYGILITLVPLIIGFFFNKYVLKLYLLNNLGSLTGAMTSTPALGTLINVAKTDRIGNPYAATYPISLISVVLSAQFMVLLMK